ncbi:hypothetical protein ADEAN_000702100 [Angomonas deanei]|uniref:RING-type domain-containing protein n=1 Tax=Angomonas deanei TaxID=59799 RepID=A0A7G2CLT3_9TRYP|nr:hypothetical protein ADEAN_000702100 [Angomonas deanei]
MPPYQPICIICLGDCDPQGVITSCNHFFCSRCNARLPPTANHACPACKKPSYGRMHLSNSSLTPLFQDVSQSFATTVKVATSQQQHAQQIVARMRGALKLLNSKYQESTEQLKQCRGSLAQSEATVQQLTQQVQRLQEELHRRGAHPSPSQHYAPPPPRDQLPNNNNNSSLHKPLGWSTTSQIAAKRVREESVPHRSEEPPAATYMTPNTCLQSPQSWWTSLPQ